MINLAIANKNNEGQMGITSIFSSIVIQFLFVIPAAILMKMYKRDTSVLALFQTTHSLPALFIPAIGIAFIVGIAFSYDRMQLKKTGIGMLFVVYIVFLLQQLSSYFHS